MKVTGQVSVKDFKTLKVIGKGSYGKVLLVEKIDSKKIYALKVLKKKEILKRNQYEHTMEERRILVSEAIIFVTIYTGKCESQLHC